MNLPAITTYYIPIPSQVLFLKCVFFSGIFYSNNSFNTFTFLVCFLNLNDYLDIVLVLFSMLSTIPPMIPIVLESNGPRREKTWLRGFANNTGADQPAHPRRLISAFVIRFLKSTIFNLATRKISSF